MRDRALTGECPCGAFRTDGRPPTVHFTGCGLGPDGSQVGAVRSDGGRWREWHDDRDPGPAPAAAAAARRRTRR